MSMTRRSALRTGVLMGFGVATTPLFGIEARHLNVALIGASNVSASMQQLRATLSKARITAIADPDVRKLPAAVATLAGHGSHGPAVYRDYGRLIAEQASVDVIVVADPNYAKALLDGGHAGKTLFVVRPNDDKLYKVI